MNTPEFKLIKILYEKEHIFFHRFFKFEMQNGIFFMLQLNIVEYVLEESENNYLSFSNFTYCLFPLTSFLVFIFSNLYSQGLF